MAWLCESAFFEFVEYVFARPDFAPALVSEEARLKMMKICQHAETMKKLPKTGKKKHPF